MFFPGQSLLNASTLFVIEPVALSFSKRGVVHVEQSVDVVVRALHPPSPPPPGPLCLQASGRVNRCSGKEYL